MTAELLARGSRRVDGLLVQKELATQVTVRSSELKEASCPGRAAVPCPVERPTEYHGLLQLHDLFQDLVRFGRAGCWKTQASHAAPSPRPRGPGGAGPRARLGLPARPHFFFFFFF